MENKIIFQVPASLYQVKTMQQWVRVIFDTPELAGDAIGRLFEWKNQNKEGWLTFNIHQIEPQDIADLPPIEKRIEDEKSPAQRLHAVMYLLWKKNPEGFKDSDSYYRAKMERIIEAYKEKLL